MFPLGTSVFTRHPAVMTWWIIAANLIVFLAELHLSPQQLQQVTYLFGVVPARFTHPAWAAGVGLPVDDYWPYFTSMFLHGGWMHIIGNMWTFWVFGRALEDRMGPIRFLVFYLVCGVASGIVHTLVNHDSTIPAIGASGAIAGVMGAFLLLHPKARVIVMIPIFFFPFIFEFLAVFYLAYWFLLQLASGTLALGGHGAAANIAFWAHVGGFLSGAILFFLFCGPRSLHRPRQGDVGEYCRS